MKVHSEVVGEQDCDEQDITELISNSAIEIFWGARLVPETKVQLSSEFPDFFREPRVLGQRPPVLTVLLDPYVEQPL